jgi:DNA primase
MVARSVDFDYVKSQVSWEGLLRYYGLLDAATRRKVAKGVELRMHCPFHEDRQPSLSEEQVELLCTHFRYLTIMMDGNEAGRKGTVECLVRLGRQRYVRAVKVPDGMEPDQLDAKDIRWLLRYE